MRKRGLNVTVKAGRVVALSLTPWIAPGTALKEAQMWRRSLFASLFLFATVLMASSATAAPITYTFDGDEASFSGTDGWQASYCADPWTTALNGGVISKTDDGCALDACGPGNNCGHQFSVWPGCQGSDPLDNHIQYGSDLWEDYIFTARFMNSDDDAVGFVFRYHNTANFYLLFFSRAMAPTVAHGCSTVIVGSRVYRVVGGQVAQLAASDMTYTQGMEHGVRIEVDGDDIVIDFDANGDGQFAESEALFSISDDDGSSAGKVGFWTYENGSAAGNTCADGSCWFDDLSVEVLDLGNDSCSGISYEGVCDGKTLKYCQNGQLITQNCQACCMWFTQNSYYACGGAQACQGCTNECSNGQQGCSSELTHSWVCAQWDDDDCLERVYTACDETGICDAETLACLGTECEPQCGGKECGGDGCGGNCGSCGANQSCSGGDCICIGEQCGGLCCPPGAQCANGACCLASCAGKQCGGDGCGGSCGQCTGNSVCSQGQCVCTPACEGKECGGDGCGGNCGACQVGFACQGGACVCVADCGGKTCGEDGCGGICGTCPEGLTCTKDGSCECVTSCANKECGDDGCGGACGQCMVGEPCVGGICICEPSCDGAECGPDSCGGTCGVCGANEVCANGLCECIPECAGKVCGDNGCNGLCGECEDNFFCEAGACKEGECVPQCTNLDCGPDGCGGICGQCGPDEECLINLCEPIVCEPKCIDKNCGPDGCGDLCGECADDELCDGGNCICVPACDGTDCGADGCGGSCGECLEGWHCKAGLCTEGLCVPDCTDKECGDDGCGAPCGECVDGLICDAGICSCLPQCDEKNCGADGCGGNCGECEPGWYCKYGTCSEGECLPSCAGIECGDDGCGGVCGTCGEGFECAAGGQCTEIVDCVPKVELVCTDDQLYWVDSCGNMGEKVQDCKYGCVDGECVEEPDADINIPTQEDTIDEPDGSSAAGGETVVFGSGTKSGGCSASPGNPAAPGLLLMILFALSLLRRRRTD